MIETVLILPALILSQPGTGGGWKTCPNNAQYRVEQDCPMAGAHPDYVYFDRDDASLTERARRTLDSIAANWHAYRRGGGTGYVSYLLLAYSDRSEAEADDLPLSRRRAGAIRQHLIGNGLPREAINTMLAGHSRPQPFEDHRESEADNRRVMIWATWREAVR